MESFEQGYDVDRFENDVSQNFCCPICLNVFKDPVMCRRNQHFFCRPCITRYLNSSQTCPSCMEELTLETLTSAPRIVTRCLSELNIRCDYFNRGCRELVLLGNLKSHVKDCGFTPVACSNEECLVEINKRDRTHHETEICEFRKVLCHNCAEISKEMDDVEMNLDAMNEKLDEMEDTNNRNFKEMKEQLGQLATLPDQIRAIQTVQEKMMREIEETKNDGTIVKRGVVVAGGWSQGESLNSVEMFDLSRKSWTPLQPMKECRQAATSFVYKSLFTVTGGYTDDGLTDSMESMTIDPTLDSAPWFNFPAKLPSKLRGHSSVVYNGRLLVIGGHDGSKCSDSIHEVSLEPPYTSKFLTRMPEPKVCASVELFNDRVFIVGGTTSFSSKDSVEGVLMYDINENECKQMAPLPVAVFDMATVSWGENVIVIGGVDKEGKELDTVVIYNVHSEKSHMLPAMKYKRRACAAVVIGDAIVVMGGLDEQGNYLKSVESFSFHRYSWEDLPPMNEGRWFATAVANW